MGEDWTHLNKLSSLWCFRLEDFTSSVAATLGSFPFLSCRRQMPYFCKRGLTITHRSYEATAEESESRVEGNVKGMSRIDHMS